MGTLSARSFIILAGAAISAAFAPAAEARRSRIFLDEEPRAVEQRPAIDDVLAVRRPDTQAVIRATLLSKEPGSASQLLAFYGMRDFTPAWTDGSFDDKLVRDVLSRADEQGLVSEDYNVPEEHGRTPEAKAAYDLSLTDALLRYAHDVRLGRVQPYQVYSDAKLPRQYFDAPGELAQALKNRALSRFLSELPPPYSEYRLLVNALAHYRATAQEGGWPSVPGTTEIKLEGKDARLKVLIARLSVEDAELAVTPNPSPSDVRSAVERFQASHGLNAYGRVASETLSALNVPAATRVQQIIANMERWRWMPRQLESRYIAVNVPEQSANYVRDGEVVLSSRVIVGRKANPTPIVRAEVQAVVANPPWNIPGFISARDLLPQLRKNPNYLATKNMMLMDGPEGDPYGRTIDWRNVPVADFPYSVRQLPGPAAALGVVMLDMPNEYDVYLHDTPGKKFFEQNDREISNGCVRVQQIFPLASLALTGDPAEGMERLNKAIASHETQRLELDKPLPVYLLYWTALPGASGEVEFRPDLYNRDAPLIKALSRDRNATDDDDAPAKPSRGAAVTTENPDLAP